MPVACAMRLRFGPRPRPWEPVRPRRSKRGRSSLASWRSARGGIHLSLRRRCRPGDNPALTFRFVPYLPDEPLVRFDPELDDNVDQQIEQALDVASSQISSAGVLLHEQHELLEGEISACRMNARDRSRMAG